MVAIGLIEIIVIALGVIGLFAMIAVLGVYLINRNKKE